MEVKNRDYVFKWKISDTWSDKFEESRLLFTTKRQMDLIWI